MLSCIFPQCPPRFSYSSFFSSLRSLQIFLKLQFNFPIHCFNLTRLLASTSSANVSLLCFCQCDLSTACQHFLLQTIEIVWLSLLSASQSVFLSLHEQHRFSLFLITLLNMRHRCFGACGDVQSHIKHAPNITFVHVLEACVGVS